MSEIDMQGYTATIGIECHVQLASKTKLFSGASNDDSDAAPNTVVSPICFGLPGTLPVLNEKAVELAIRAGLALDAEINLESKFDRKHYFYPDLPKGYQITQFYQPIVGKGSIKIIVDGNEKSIGVEHAHLEEDAGKSSHTSGSSLVDLNRAGTPLLEIVSDPDMHSPAEARGYAQALYLRMKYAGVSNVDLYHGNMRFDVNVSISKTDELGTRTETKNLNSFRSVERAAEHEIKRQIEVLEEGGNITQETRGWDDAGQKTFSQRSKEDAHDYRYMPEPDVPPIELEQSYVNELRQQMPIGPDTVRAELGKFQLDSSQVEVILEEPEVAQYVLNITDTKVAKTIINWLTSEVSRAVSDSELTWQEAIANPKQLQKLAQMYLDKQLSSTAAKELLANVIAGEDPEDLAKSKNLLQVSDEGEIAKIVAQVIADNEKPAQDVKNGEMKAIGFLVGQVMKASHGKANPQLAQELIKKHLNI